MSLDQKFLEELIIKIGESAHGNINIIELSKTLLKAKPHEIISFLKKTGLKDSVQWEYVKDKIWSEFKVQEINRFPFIQGDIISTTSVSRLAQARSTVSHAKWIVCTPTCDVVRRKYIRVAPLFQILMEYKAAESANNKLYMAFKTALYFKTSQRFPLPPLNSDQANVLGYFADFEEPFFLEDEFKFLATPICSLTISGWHLFNAIIQQLETRANMDEEIRIRSV